MRNQSFQMETELNFRAQTILRTIHTNILAITAWAVVSLLAQSAFAGSAEPEKGATRLLQPSKPALIETLPSEQDDPVLRGLLDRLNALPLADCFPDTEHNGHHVRIAVHQYGSGTHGRVVVMIHGLGADGSAWRYVGGELGTDFDLWVVDLPGCGRSDKPDPKSIEPDGYSPTAMADRLFQALHQCLAARLQPPRLVLAAHSLGGMTALRMLGDPDLRERHEYVRRQIDGMVLLSPCDVAVNQANPIFIGIANLRDWEVGVGRALGIVEHSAAKSDLDGFCHRDSAKRESTARLVATLSTGEKRHAMQAMIRQAVPWLAKENRPDWDGITRLESHYTNIDVPCLIVWGQRDETLSVAIGYKLAAQIRGAKLVVLPDCMHSIELECPATCAKIIREFDSEVQLARNAKAKPETMTDKSDLARGN